MRYFDKRGTEIEAGMKLRHDDGAVDVVYTGETEEGRKALGFNNATNETWLRKGRDRQVFPLYEFNLNEWEVVE